MKINLKTVLSLSMFLLSAIFVFAQSPVETTVFMDDFEGTFPTSGNPETTYTIVRQTISGDAPDDPSYQSGMLRFNAPKSSATRNGVFGNLSDFAAPFASKLNEINADSVVWTFNMRANRETTSGFSDDKFGIATVLLSDVANYNTANGYVVISMGANASSRSFRLAKFSNGLDADTKFTDLIIGLPGSAMTYAALKVVFVKNTNTWSFYGRADSGAFSDPSQGSYTFFGSVVDDTFINTSMSNFGFFMMCKSYTTSTTYNIDNFAVKTYITASGVSQYEVDKLFKTHLLPGAIEVETTSAIATLHDITGAVQHRVFVNGKTAIKVPNKGLYILKIELSDGRTGAKKITID